MDELLKGIVIVFIALSLSAFFSMCETAVTGISPLKAQHLLKTHGKSAQALNLWLKHPHRILAAVLLGNNLTNIFASIFVDKLIGVNFGGSSIVVVSALMTITIVLFAEVIPKTFAKTHAHNIVIPVLNIFSLFYFILLPFTLAITAASNFFTSLFIHKKNFNSPQMTEDELEFLINVGEKEGIIAENKHGMLSGIFELGDTVVREIMVHRTDIVAIPHTLSVTEVVKKFKETGLSRIPIYDEKVDNIIGIVHAKDALFFLKALSEKPSEGNKNSVSEIKREVLFVPETKPVDQVFQELRLHKQHMAIVLDEYGGTGGLVTMEDIFEEIVGEVRDEFDNEEDAIRPTQNPAQYIVECKIHIDDFCEFFDLEWNSLGENLEREEFDTLGGYILFHFGRIPRIGEKLEISKLEMEVIDVSRRRIRRVMVKKIQPEILGTSPDNPPQHTAV